MLAMLQTLLLAFIWAAACHLHFFFLQVSNTPFIAIFGAFQLLLSQIPDFDRLWFLSIVAAVMSFSYSSIGLGLAIGKATGPPFLLPLLPFAFCCLLPFLRPLLPFLPFAFCCLLDCTLVLLRRVVPYPMTWSCKSGAVR